VHTNICASVWCCSCSRLKAPTHETHETRASHICHTIGINTLTLASLPTTCATMTICRVEMMGATKYGIAVKVSFILRWACALYDYMYESAYFRGRVSLEGLTLRSCTFPLSRRTSLNEA